VRQRYPVFVEETAVRLVWIAADDAEEAAGWAKETPWEYTKDVPTCDGWADAYAPNVDSGYDWDAVYGYGGAADEQDHHVQLHRAEMWRRELVAKQAACHEARHPDVTVYGTGSIWCKGCTEYLYVAPERAS